MPLAGLDMKRMHPRNGDDQPKWRPVTNLFGFVFSHPRKSAFFYGAVSSEGVASCASSSNDSSGLIKGASFLPDSAVVRTSADRV
jgi:hypothetical protein